MDALESPHAADHRDETNEQLPPQRTVRARLEHVNGAARVEDCLAQAGEEGDLLHRALLGVRLHPEHTHDKVVQVREEEIDREK